MAITRDATDVWSEISAKAEQCRVDGTLVYTLVDRVPNRIIRVESDRIWRQSEKPVSDAGGPSDVPRSEVERIWKAICENGQAIQEDVKALRFAWALIAAFVEGIEFRADPFRLIVADFELANRSYQKKEEPICLVLMQHSPEFTKYDDQIGEQYHYPSQYFERIVEGARFIYCRPREGEAKTVYFGTGRIGTIRKDVSKEGHRYCQIEDYFEFPLEVCYRNEDDAYIETSTTQITVMQSAVRVITQNDFRRIVERSGLNQTTQGHFGRLQDFKNDHEIIQELNEAYQSATPKQKQYWTSRVERGAAIGGRVKEMNGYICQVCGGAPFITRTGRPYSEAHHVVPLHKLQPGSLASENVICVCANCHRKMHYGNVETGAADECSITFEIDGKQVIVKRNRLQVESSARE